MKQFIIVCEGASERAYLQVLQAYLEASIDTWDVPLKLTPKEPVPPAGGFFRNVLRCYNEERRQNVRHGFAIWVDHDIYFREGSAKEKNNRKHYLTHCGTPQFYFSFHNFEDFLVLHLDATRIQLWHDVFDAKRHVDNPLHSKEYTALFKQILPGYKKGEMPSGFISREALLRLKTNLDNPLIPPPNDARFPSFAQFLITQIDAAYPDLLVS